MTAEKKKPVKRAARPVDKTKLKPVGKKRNGAAQGPARSSTNDGGFAFLTHAEPMRQLPAGIDEVRMARLQAEGYANAAIIPGNEHQNTSPAEFWNKSVLAGEYRGEKTDYPKMPDDFTPSRTTGRSIEGLRRTHRMRYKGQDGIELRMPSASSVKLFSGAHNNPVFDVPIEYTTETGQTAQGFVRVKKVGNGAWQTRMIGGDPKKPTINEIKAAEAVAAVLESRRPSTGLMDAGNLLDQHKRRTARWGGTTSEKVMAGGSIKEVGYNPSMGVMTANVAGRLIGRSVPPEVHRELMTTDDPLRVWQHMVRRARTVDVLKCVKCGRVHLAQTAHVCPARGGQLHARQVREGQSGLLRELAVKLSTPRKPRPKAKPAKAA